MSHELGFWCASARVVERVTGLRPSAPAKLVVSLIQISECVWASPFGAANGFCGTPLFAVGCALAGAPM